MKDSWKPVTSGVYMTEDWIGFEHANGVMCRGPRADSNTATTPPSIAWVPQQYPVYNFTNTKKPSIYI